MNAWASIVEDAAKAKSYKEPARPGRLRPFQLGRGHRDHRRGQRLHRQDHGPDRVIGFSPIPAMSMVSYAAGARYLSLIGGVCLSFYDWYCDLPPASPQIWGEQTDVPESADWVQLQLHHRLGLQRAADADPDALLHRGALQGHQDRLHHPGLFRGGQAHRPLAQPQAGHRRRAGHGLRSRDPEGSSTSTGRAPTSSTTAASTPTCRCWCCWKNTPAARSKPTRYLRAADLADNLGQDNTRVEDHRLRRAQRRAGLAHRRHRLPLGRVWQVEHRRAGRQER